MILVCGVAFGWRKVGMSFRHWNYMGASLQAPCATPGQRQMETLSWIELDGLFVAPYKATINN